MIWRVTKPRTSLQNKQGLFCKGRSCLSQLLVQQEYVLDCLEEGNNVDMVYLDFAKAFTEDWRHLLYLHIKHGYTTTGWTTSSPYIKGRIEDTVAVPVAEVDLLKSSQDITRWTSGCAGAVPLPRHTFLCVPSAVACCYCCYCCLPEVSKGVIITLFIQVWGLLYAAKSSGLACIVWWEANLHRRGTDVVGHLLI
ncbi:hypothetical protein O3P69_006691 [Scylla paramamosain]|uniref:Reverse transcriptase domain-containing protein n=1 Tax=Scylla paramamosain TaxID=85552 RepID=A0AAW0U3Y9_SCYPA